MQFINKISFELKRLYGKEKPTISQNIYNELNIPKKTFGMYLRNEKQPRLDELQRIAQWLGVDAKDLF